MHRNGAKLLTLLSFRALWDDVPYTALPGVPETIRNLKHKGYILGVATVDSLTATVAGLKKTGSFDYLGSGEESKPKWDGHSNCRFNLNCLLIPNMVHALPAGVHRVSLP
jgi:phosphoglycolate phosphatase-like HAD superfamily hydrolase